MKEAVFWDFFSFFVKDGVPQGFFVQCCVYVCTNIYTQTSECVFWKRFTRPPTPHPTPPPPTAPYRSDSTVQKTSKQTRHRHAAARKCVLFPLTLSVFAVVLCGVRSHTTPAHLPLRPVPKSDPPQRHASDEGWKVSLACRKEEGSDVVR